MASSSSSEVPRAAQWPGYPIVFFDCDSTLVAVEGIDELARLKGLGEEVAEATRRAMEGSVSLEAVYGERLEKLRPTPGELRRLGTLYRESLVPDAVETVAALHLAGSTVHLVTGGLLPAIRSLARALGIPPERVHAVTLSFDELSGRWWQPGLGPDTEDQKRYLACAASPLTEARGKRRLIDGILRSMPAPRASMLVGDGVTDLEARDAVRLFVGFGGVVRRPAVAEAAPVFIEERSLSPVLPLALSPGRAAALGGTRYQEIFARGLEALAGDGVRFRDEVLRARLLAAHRRAEGALTA